MFNVFIYVINVSIVIIFFFQAEDGIRDYKVTGVQTCALPIFRLILVCSTACWNLQVDGGKVWLSKSGIGISRRASDAHDGCYSESDCGYAVYAGHCKRASAGG